ncbi:MAG: glycosyltransferase family 2 protein [Parabacteroides sp.]
MKESYINTTSIKISVIIPTYKPHAYIMKCLDSVSRQTLNHDLFELIIIVNGCNEPYYPMIKKEIEKLQLSAQIIQTDVPGVSNARNLGLMASKGEYVTFLDDDDWLSDNYLENLLTCMKGDNCITIANAKNYNEQTKQIEDKFFAQAYKKCLHNDTLTLLKGRTFLSTSCCKLIPSNMIHGAKFDKALPLGEDAYFMATISHRIKYIILAPPNTIYYIRERKNSASRAKHKIGQVAINTILLVYKYTSTYFSHPTQYNLPFFLNRLFAILKNAMCLLRS